MSYQTTVEVPVTVDYEYHPASRGHRDKYGAPEEPDEDDSVEVTHVWVGNSDIINLIPRDQINDLEDEILESLANDV